MRPAPTLLTAGTPPRRRPFPTIAGLLVAAALVSACSQGGGGTAGMPEGGEVPRGDAPSGNNGGGRGDDTRTEPPCINTHDEGCVSLEEFESRAAELAEDFRTQRNFQAQWGLATITAHEAYGRLALAEGMDVEPGAGQTIGLIDTGIDQEHPLFYGKTVTEEFLQGAVDEIGDELSHGTAVASVMAGIRVPPFGRYPHGVAWGADLASFALPLGTAPEYFSPVSLEALKGQDTHDAALYRHVLEWESEGRRLDFLNLSFGYSGLIDSYRETDLRTSFGETIGVLAQRDTDEKTIFVWAAGNMHGDKCIQDAPYCVRGTDEEEGTVDASSVGLLSGLPLYFEELRGHHLAVVAVGADGGIAAFSNRCGSAAEWCLAAPGVGVRFAYFGPFGDGTPGGRGLGVGAGTSFAAPMVTGGLAVMKHLFRAQLSNTDLVARMLETADRSGPYADETIYGRGLLDLGAATTPVGQARFSLAGTVEGESAPLAETALASGGALGDGLTASLAGHEIAAFDALGAPFWFDLGDFASIRDERSFASQLRDFMAPTRGLHGLGARPVISLRREHGAWIAGHEDRTGMHLGLLDTPTGAEGGHLGLAEHALTLSLGGPDGMTATAFSTEGTDGASPASGALLSWHAGDRPFGLRAGWLGEREALLGTSANGAFGSLSADAVFAGIDGEADLGGWRLFGGAEFGTVSAAPTAGLIDGLSPLTTTAFAFRATRPLGDDRGLSFAVSQPLRVESGRATLSVPVGRTRGGDVLRRTMSTAVAPTGRQIDVAARWHRRWTDSGEVRLGAVWTRQPGHRADADSSLALLAGWRQAF